jgi:hypothetical protein
MEITRIDFATNDHELESAAITFEMAIYFDLSTPTGDEVCAR